MSETAIQEVRPNMNTELLDTLITTRDAMLEKKIQAEKEVEAADRELAAFQREVLIKVVLPKIEVIFPDGKKVWIDSLEKMRALREWADLRLNLFKSKITEEEFEAEVISQIEILRSEKILTDTQPEEETLPIERAETKKQGSLHEPPRLTTAA